MSESEFPAIPGQAADDDGPLVERAEIIRASIGLGIYAVAFGLSFGAVSVAAGLDVAQTMVLSMVLFSGASQFAFVGVAATGSPFAAIPAALLLGARNTFYAVSISQILRPRGWRRLLAAHWSIDETAAMTAAQRSPRAKKFAFWASGAAMFSLWVTGSFAGAMLGTVLDTSAFGLDAAAPAAFLALLWPNLRTVRARWVAVGAVALALVLIPIAPAGVPVLAAVSVAVLAGWREAKQKQAKAGQDDDGSDQGTTEQGDGGQGDGGQGDGDADPGGTESAETRSATEPATERATEPGHEVGSDQEEQS